MSSASAASAKIFRSPVTLNIIYNLFDQVCLLKNDFYIFDINSFNKMKHLDLLEPFLSKLKEYYFPHKYGILNEEQSLNHFMMIIKQICKYHKLKVKTEICQDYPRYMIEHK